MRSTEKGILEKNIFEYLSKKGEIKAVLYHKLKKRMQIAVSELMDDFDSLLLELMWGKKIEIIIPEICNIKWIKKDIVNTRFIKENTNYLVSTFLPIEKQKFLSSNHNFYSFDSRKLNFFSKSCRERSKQYLLESFQEHPNKIIIFNPVNSKPLNIYEPLEIPFKIQNTWEFKNSYQEAQDKVKFEIPFNDQIQGLEILKNFKTKFACAYITIIESIHKKIIEMQNKNVSKNSDLFKEYMKKFIYYCEMFIKSDWMFITDPNPGRWESFFVYFQIPFKIIDMKIKSIRFTDKTFETHNNIKYGIKLNSQEDLNYLKQFGYEEFNGIKEDNQVIIGLDLNFIIPSPSIEYYYFIAKYIHYYHLFLLLNHSLQILEDKIKEKFTSSKEKKIYEYFLPILDSMFDIDQKKVKKNLIFKYYTTSYEELEVLYNFLLMRKIKNVEQKLTNYMLFKNFKPSSRNYELTAYNVKKRNI